MDHTTGNLPSWQRPTTSLSARTGPSAKQTFATERARLLLGQFRKGEANDPATFVTAIAAVLARYSEEIILEVTHPFTGMAAKSSWLPTVHEVVQAYAWTT